MNQATRIPLVLAAIFFSLCSAAIEFAVPQNVPPLFEPGVTPKSEAGWRNVRRPELKKILETEVYGRRPVERPPHLVFSAAEPDAVMMDGAATRKRIRVEYGGKYGTNSFVFTAFIPRAAKPAPSFVFICNRPPEENIDPTRKVKSGFWPAEEIVARGYATMAFWTSDVTPDKQHGNTRGAFAAFEDVEKQYRSQTAWGALSVWAWAASRVLDWIETEPTLDAAHVAVIGHSRGGKTALVAAAWDERFAMAVSSCSGAGGAKLHHVDLPDSEHIVQSVASHQFWYCRRYTRWVNLDAQAPFDQHMLLACVAPRALLVEGFDQGWFDTKGEYLAVKAASPVWKFLGKKGMPDVEWPSDYDTSAIGPSLGYVRRAGEHGIAPIDWEWMLDFAEGVWNKTK